MVIFNSYVSLPEGTSSNWSPNSSGSSPHGKIQETWSAFMADFQSLCIYSLLENNLDDKRKKLDLGSFLAGWWAVAPFEFGGGIRDVWKKFTRKLWLFLMGALYFLTQQYFSVSIHSKHGARQVRSTAVAQLSDHELTWLPKTSPAHMDNVWQCQPGMY